ncbi:MAG: palindromic element RPE2 domain-containing protein [Rickettsia endosymbiont of Gnoriste bilineata]|nr:palindromic element RPE2 domain-containing protein [Rickettsia endosymbiont of Gnoriste bilineata]
MVNSGEFGARHDGATPISNRRATSDDVTNFSSIDYSHCARRLLCNTSSLREAALRRRGNPKNGQEWIALSAYASSQ